MTRKELETALDAHRLWIKEEWDTGPRWYLARRNGRTRLWATSDRWVVPIKYKLKNYVQVTDKNIDEVSPYLRAGHAEQICSG